MTKKNKNKQAAGGGRCSGPRDDESVSTTQRPKLLVTASTFPRWAHDTEPRFILDLCKALAKYFDITVLVPAAPGAADSEILEGINVIRYHYFPIHRFETLCYPGAIVPRIKEKKIRALLVPFLFLSLYCQLWRRLKNYDLAYANWVIPQGIVQSFFSTPYLVTGLGGDVSSLNMFPIKQLKRRCLTRARGVTMVSYALKQKAEEIAPTINAAMIPMSIYTEKFGPKFHVGNNFEQGDKKVVLYVGRLAEKKGVTYLIDAMTDIDALLVIAGDGPLHSQLEKQVDSNPQLISKVKFIGPKTNEQLRPIYASADILVVPSITAKDGDSEGTPTVIIEGMASGIPIVASRSGGISQIIADNRNGLLVPEKDVASLAQCIQKLLDNPQLAQKLAKNARKTVAQYDYSHTAPQYYKLLTQRV